MNRRRELELAKEVGKIVRQLREENDLTQEELAEMSGVGKVVISRLENGNTRQVSIHSFAKILDTLGYKMRVVPK
ncbi:MAG: helix-turn-helix transcriptional regulator [Campylobacterales bacterium]